MKDVCEGGAEAVEEAGMGYRTKNKNPTQRCGVQYCRIALPKRGHLFEKVTAVSTPSVSLAWPLLCAEGTGGISGIQAARFAFPSLRKDAW